MFQPHFSTNSEVNVEPPKKHVIPIFEIRQSLHNHSECKLPRICTASGLIKLFYKAIMTKTSLFLSLKQERKNKKFK